MNTRQIHIFFDIFKAIQQFVKIIHVFCKSCEPKIVFVTKIKTKTISGSQFLQQQTNNQTNCCNALEKLKKI